MTNCLAIDEIQSQNDTHFTLEINHVESYYNFRTVGNYFKLVTLVNQLIQIKLTLRHLKKQNKLINMSFGRNQLLNQ